MHVCLSRVCFTDCLGDEYCVGVEACLGGGGGGGSLSAPYSTLCCLFDL